MNPASKEGVRIDLLIPNFEDLGAQRVAINVANILHPRHQVSFVVFENIGPFRHYLHPGIKVVVLDDFIKPIPKVRVLLRMWAYAKYARRNRTQIANSFSPGTNYVALFAKLLFRPLKAIVQEHEFPEMFLKDRENVSGLYEFFFTHILVRWYNRADMFITPAEAVKTEFESHYPTKKGLTKVIRNPMDLEYIITKAKEEPKDFSFKRDTRYLVNTGRLADQKNQARLIRIFQKICVARGDVELIIIGKGHLESALQQQAREAGLEDKVHLVGFKHNPYQYIARADCFCLSSNWEALPVVIAEAMLCRTLVAANDCKSGPAEMIRDNETGILVPYGDEELFARKILEILEQPAKKKEMEERAYRFAAEEYSLQKIRERYEEVITQLTGHAN